MQTAHCVLRNCLETHDAVLAVELLAAGAFDMEQGDSLLDALALAAGGARMAREPGEWVAALQELRDDPAMREELAAKGRSFVERTYSSAAIVERLRRVLGF